MARVTIRPVTPENRADFEALFSARGCPSYCWCANHRIAGARDMTNDQKRAAMLARIAEGGPVGVLAYEGQTPIGWCSVAPRESYAPLEGSRTMHKVEDGAWTVLCFFVRRDHRGKGVPAALLRAAIKYARDGGARAVEGYPSDTSGTSSRHRGRSALFRAAGFTRAGRRWSKPLRSRR
jgi:GNAT superfamily N-acetyltransferase